MPKDRLKGHFQSMERLGLALGLEDHGAKIRQAWEERN
jgi:hypothetical protein